MNCRVARLININVLASTQSYGGRVVWTVEPVLVPDQPQPRTSDQSMLVIDDVSSNPTRNHFF